MQRIGKGRVSGTRTAMKKTERENGRVSWDSVVIADVAADVELYIDVENLIKHLGRRALHNKSGYAVLASGDIEVRVVRGTRKEVARAQA